MKHHLHGLNFHGGYAVDLIGPAAGFILTDSQASRVAKALCGVAGCTCGGGYGDGPDPDSARIVSMDDGRMKLIPARTAA